MPITATFTVAASHSGGVHSPDHHDDKDADTGACRSPRRYRLVVQNRSPSGLFPAGPHGPTFREPHPARSWPAVIGAGATSVWLLLMGLLARSVASFFWLTIVAVLLASAVAVVLVRAGDRGAAVGVGVVAGLGACIAATTVIVRLIIVGWPVW